MTRDEIRLVSFILAALAIGAFVRWRMAPASSELPAAGDIPERASGWANPPYVFKSRAAMEKVKGSVAEEP